MQLHLQLPHSFEVEWLRGHPPSSIPIVYLQADVCREDLLVEIEATGESGGPANR